MKLNLLALAPILVCLAACSSGSNDAGNAPTEPPKSDWPMEVTIPDVPGAFTIYASAPPTQEEISADLANLDKWRQTRKDVQKGSTLEVSEDQFLIFSANARFCDPASGDAAGHMSALVALGPALRRLELNDAPSLRDEHLAQIGALTRLDGIFVTSAKVTDAGVAHLAATSSLRSLNIEGALITDQGLKSIGQLKALNTLSLAECPAITDAGIAHLAGLTELRMLSLDGKLGLSGAALVHMRAMTKLQSLFLSGGLLDTAGMKEVGKVAALRMLLISNGKGMTDDGLRELLNLPQLEDLTILSCDKLTRAGFLELTKLKSLKKIFASCDGINQATRDEFKRLRPDVDVG